MVPELQDLHLGEKFTKWRRHQRYAVYQALNTKKRFMVQVQPTGSGKTLCYVAAATLRPGRTLILTSFKGLQDQLHQEHNLFVLMGRSSYPCRRNPDVTCDEGLCRIGEYCAYKMEMADGFGCYYLQNILRSTQEKIVVANYSFWLSNNYRFRNITVTNAMGETSKITVPLLGTFDYMICDEAHIIPNYILDYMSITLRPKQVVPFIGWIDKGQSFNDYHAWMKKLHITVDSKARDVKKLGASVAKKSAIVKLANRLDKITYINADNWVIEHTGDTIKAGMIWPTDVVQKLLFKNVPKVLLTSATIDKHTCTQMGLDESNSGYMEYASSFAATRRPIYSVPCVRVDFKWTTQMQNKWMRTIDNIIGARLGRKGIIHAVSYARCRYIMENSIYRDLMITHTSKTTRSTVEKFKKSTDKVILVSPSVVTGWDFPYDECRWQIICKVPFPDLRSDIDRARKEKDPNFGNLLATQNLVQICGRGMRFTDDWCETIIIDDHFRWFKNKISQWSPGWFQEAVKLINSLPEPLNI